MPWYKPKDKEPPSRDEEYFIRNIGDKYTGWWDTKRREFYTFMGRENTICYFEKNQYPNIEWWDESEPDQNVLWEELDQIFYNGSGGQWVIPEYIIDVWKSKYTLTRK